jgi:hypothetical protein
MAWWVQSAGLIIVSQHPGRLERQKGKSTHPELPDKLLNRILQHITQLLASLEQGQSICFSQLGGTLGRCVEDLLRE